MRRRDFFGVVAGATVWPLAGQGQQRPVPVVGWLGAGSADAFAGDSVAFRKGLSEMGFVEGSNIAIEYLWAAGQYDRLPAMATDLVHRRVSIIMASGGPFPTRAAKAATSTIPIVFIAPADPAALGLVESLSRPGGNVTGVNFFLLETQTKLLGLLHELVPGATTIGMVFSAIGVGFGVVPIATELETAAHSLGLRLRAFGVATAGEVDDMFAAFTQQPVDGLVVRSSPVMSNWIKQIAAQAAKLSIPSIGNLRDFVDTGGLMSYGTSVEDAYRQAGLYVGRILKGEMPADLPVIQSTKFEFVINAKTAKALGLTIPPNLLAVADEVIE
jgi:putative tryptophan/tyrosine transport system substrate-binding protein